ncbi:M48 family metalloprotease [Sneathiella sp. P13V-1]|uniref:M48 family metalloprotease n=1 Tax=Sneathiella sp. P13V-1 TaxID=2697366 RepID=UPI00187BA532|nr:M48 family metalloprotease [Sneathiella sp. P13V-1]MBE7636544.1 M48 family metalloprotease [Sneathiella sp. P13V-1]
MMSFPNSVLRAIAVPALCFSIAIGNLVSPTVAYAETRNVADIFSIFEPSDEQAIGASQHKKIVEQYGGEYIQEGLNDYILDIVLRIVSTTEQRNQPWRVTVLNSPVVNAFALPGGYVYVTRGLLALARNEAEVAGVLGHEVGHVIARHGVQRQSRATGVGILGAIAGILTQNADVARLGQTLGGLFIADYSRDQEYEADSLGLKYLGSSGYPRMAVADFLQRLEDHAEFEKKKAGKDGQSGQFDFFASHPQTEDRIDRARSLARQADEGERDNGRDRYLAATDGLKYGDDIKEGVIRGRTFIHPDLRLTFDAPKGFQLINSTRAVYAQDRNGNRMVFDMDPRGLRGQSAASYLQNVWMKNYQVGNIQSLDVNGAQAAYSRINIKQNNGRVTYLTAVVINFGYERVVRFAYTSKRRSNELEERYIESFQSFRPIAYSEASKIKQLTLAIKTVGYREDLDDLVDEMPEGKFRKDLFLLLNPEFKKRDPKRGDQYKIIQD